MNWDFIWKQIKEHRTIYYSHFCYFKTLKRSFLNFSTFSSGGYKIARSQRFAPPLFFKKLDPTLLGSSLFLGGSDAFLNISFFRERTFLIYELYISTIALVSAGILFGIFASLLAIVNTAYNPIEAICHVPGKQKTSLIKGCSNELFFQSCWIIFVGFIKILFVVKIFEFYYLLFEHNTRY